MADSTTPDLRYYYQHSGTIGAAEVFDGIEKIFVAKCPSEDLAKRVTDALNFKYYSE